MGTKLFIIDPQNDFCDIESAALPVPGASADLERLSAFVAQSGETVTEITVTLDSHPYVAIERVTFWRRADGGPVAPFTEITSEVVRQGRYLPRNGKLLPEVIEYLCRLEAQGRYRLMVWPVHCVLGTPGHNIYAPLARALADWEVLTQRQVVKVLKGSNPLTEHYSAIRAEVVRHDDPGTGVNDRLIERVRPAAGEGLLVAGEAASHCVRATVVDLLEAFSDAERSRTVLLADSMSPVPGFEAQARTFLTEACAAGARLMSCEEALAALERNGSIR